MNAKDGFPLAFVNASDRIGRYEDTAAQARALVELVGLRPGASILDIPCGIGRFSLELHRLGFKVTAIDLSREQVEYAQQHNSGPTYIIGDMRRPPHGEYDLAVNLYSSFGYFDTVDEDRALLKVWHECLRPGGILIMELSDTERAMYRLGNQKGEIVREYPGCREYLRMNWETKVLTTSYEIPDRPKFTCSARLYAKEDLASMLLDAGFSNVKTFGSFSGKPKEPQDRAILLAQRSAFPDSLQ